ncbi:MAG: TIGR00266 family protein [Proteobacteria bacterium]|nr:TIGR00266 family protein [Pseudomonadota bacterium]
MSSSWYVAINGKQEGPISTEHILNNLQNGVYTLNTYVWKQGFANWKEISQCPELSSSNYSTLPRLPQNVVDQIDYEIFGSEMQFVEIELDPHESVVAEAGAMMYMSDFINMATVFGDGSEQPGSGLLDRMLGAGKRLITGEGLFSTIFTYTGAGKGKVAFAAPYPGKIIPLDLKDFSGKLVCQKDAFLCAAKGVAIGIEFQKKIGTALFGGEGFIMQKLEGDGKIFVHAGGTIIQKDLQAGEKLRIDTGCLVAMTKDINYDIEFVGGVKSALFGGEGFFFATITGPGHVWLQSLPFSRLAGRIHKAAPQNNAGFSAKGEGSVLGELGNLFQR